GVFGHKPSFGRVPAWPASPFGMLSHTGPITRTVTDAALMLSVLAEPDGRDMNAWNTAPPDFRVGLEDGVKGLRIAWSPRLGYITKVDPEVLAACEKAARSFADLGAIVEEAEPGFPDAADDILTLWLAVSATVVDGLSPAEREMLDPGFRRVAELGRRYTLAEYIGAFNRRAEYANAMLRFHERYDLLLTPQMATPAIEAGLEAPADGSYGDLWVEWSPYTYPFNLTQQPAASVPCGLTSNGLPIGLQIVGPARNDAIVLRAARAYESAHPFATISAPRA
ncbi:MAG: amidase, partial [Rhizobiales bacterium]|nr:amidase [Hyphomicrobiales bacterium]